MLADQWREEGTGRHPTARIRIHGFERLTKPLWQDKEKSEKHMNIYKFECQGLNLLSPFADDFVCDLDRPLISLKMVSILGADLQFETNS
jgi:hypothetical protein